MAKLLVLCVTLSFNNNRIIVGLYLPSDWVSNIMRRSYFRIKLLRIMQSMGILLPANGFRYTKLSFLGELCEIKMKHLRAWVGLDLTFQKLPNSPQAHCYKHFSIYCVHPISKNEFNFQIIFYKLSALLMEFRFSYFFLF